MSEIKLYDMNTSGRPSKRGDVFYSKQVYKCQICGALSNCIVIGGYPSLGERVCCPNSAENWHHSLGDKLDWLRHPHPAEYKRALEKEIDEFRRQHAGQVKNEIIGEPDLTPVGGMTNVRSFRL